MKTVGYVILTSMRHEDIDNLRNASKQQMSVLSREKVKAIAGSKTE